MKRYLILLLTTIALLGLQGCDTERVASLDGSVDERINKLIDGYVEDLVDSEYGWMASIKTSKGYYRFWMDFQDKNKVTMYTDNRKVEKYMTEAQETSYAFRAFQRPTLVFDTYCYVSILNDPDNSISGGSGNKGLLTDFEFEVVRYNKEKGVFHMQGRFNKVNALFVKASKEDMIGAQSGEMMRLQKELTDNRDLNRYICANVNGIEVVTKIKDYRYTYQFWYDDRKKEGMSEESFFNFEVNGSGDFLFPEPIDLGNDKLTGLKFDNSSKRFVGFYGEDGQVYPASDQLEPPTFPLPIVYGHMAEGKLFNASSCPSGLVSNLAVGPTRSSLDLFSKFLISGGGLQLVFSYAQNYYFTFDEEIGQFYLNIYMAPSGLGVGWIEGELSIVTSFPIALYKFPITVFDESGAPIPVNDLSPDVTFTKFRTSASYSMNDGARKYYTDRVTTELIDYFKSETFNIQWSEAPYNDGLIIEFRAEGKDFYPPSVLYNRG